jgi:hypothetical protein
MDLLVGVVCEDGVVVASAGSDLVRPGSDAGASPSEITFTVRDDLVLAGSGRAGLGRRFGEVVGAIRSDSRFLEWTGLTIAKMICAEAVDDFASTRAEKGQFGALLAFSACDGAQLCEFGPGDLQPELKQADRCFALIGTGRPVAEPFARFLRRVLFADSLPTVREGVFAATWMLDYTIGLSAGAEPVRIAILPNEETDLPAVARLLSTEESLEVLAAVRKAEKHLAAYRGNLSSERR